MPTNSVMPYDVEAVALRQFHEIHQQPLARLRLSSLLAASLEGVPQGFHRKVTLEPCFT